MKRNFKSCPSKIAQAVVILTAALALVGGGGPGLPEIVPVSGTVTIDGKPYQRVMVRFTPLQEGLDGNSIAIGQTDMQGKYTVELPGKGHGAYACECAVTIHEGEIPAEVRESGNDQMAATAYMNSLQDRPIPRKYNLINDTPLRFKVTADKATYDLELTKQ